MITDESVVKTFAVILLVNIRVRLQIIDIARCEINPILYADFTPELSFAP